MDINFNGYNDNVATFMADDTVLPGYFVKAVDSFTVGACETGDEVLGKCLSVRDGYAAVKLSGYVEVVMTCDVEVGYQGFVAQGATTMAPSDDAKKMYDVIYCKNGKIGLIL